MTTICFINHIYRFGMNLWLGIQLLLLMPLRLGYS